MKSVHRTIAYLLTVVACVLVLGMHDAATAKTRPATAQTDPATNTPWAPSRDGLTLWYVCDDNVVPDSGGYLMMALHNVAMRNPVVQNFGMKWTCTLGSMGKTYTLKYDRHRHRIRYQEDGAMSGEAFDDQVWYSGVTDKVLARVIKDHPDIVYPDAFLTYLPKYGCKKHITHQLKLTWSIAA